MRRLLCALLLSVVLGIASATAGELTTAQAQQLVDAAKSAKAGGDPVEVTLVVDGKNVTFKVSRDAVGNVLARPVPGPDNAGADVALVSIQMKANANGVLVPVQVVVVNGAQAVAGYSLNLNDDGTIKNLYQPGKGNGGASVADKPLVGGIQSTALKEAAKNDQIKLASHGDYDFLFAIDKAIASLPAGTTTGSASGFHP